MREKPSSGLETPNTPGSPRYDRALQALAFWLMGWPDKRRPWAVQWCGNRLQDLRYALWRKGNNG